MCAVESELSKNKEIIAQYKDICSKMSERLEKTNLANKEEMEHYQVIIVAAAYNLVLVRYC